jgi:hypothetical protein
MTRKEGRDELGLESEDADDVYLVPMAVFEVPRGQSPEERAASLAASSPPAGEGDKSLKHSHGLAEQRIVARAPRRRPPQVAMRYAAALDKLKRRAMSVFEPLLEDVFAGLGRMAQRAARDALADVELADNTALELKAGELSAADALLAEAIIDSLDTAAAQASLRQAYEQGFLTVATNVFDELSSIFGVTFNIDDATQQAVLTEGGLRAGLIDLDQQSRDAIFEALAEGRAEGMAGENLARHIRDNVEAGPWKDPATRARVIARTEGAHAANTSTLEAARADPDTEHVMVFDNRSGFDDEECAAANGIVVTIDEAEAMGLAHPNCTRAFAPINSLLAEELAI